MPSAPVPQDQITGIFLGHISWSLFQFLTPFILSPIKKTFPAHLRTESCSTIQGTHVKRGFGPLCPHVSVWTLWVDHLWKILSQLQNGMSCPYLQKETLEAIEYPVKGHSALDNDVKIPLSPHEHTQHAPTLCYCHYGDKKEKRTMRVGCWMPK